LFSFPRLRGKAGMGAAVPQARLPPEQSASSQQNGACSGRRIVRCVYARPSASEDVAPRATSATSALGHPIMNSATVLRGAFVRLRRNKTSTALVVVVVGTTLGAALCAVSFAWMIVARPLPYPEQERLVVARQLIFDHGEQPDSRQFSFPALAVVHEEGKQVFTASVMMDHARDVVVSHPAQ